MDINNHIDEMRKMLARIHRLEFALGLVNDLTPPERHDMTVSEWPDPNKKPQLHPALVSDISAQLQPQQQLAVNPGPVTVIDTASAVGSLSDGAQKN